MLDCKAHAGDRGRGSPKGLMNGESWEHGWAGGFLGIVGRGERRIFFFSLRSGIAYSKISEVK